MSQASRSFVANGKENDKACEASERAEATNMTAAGAAGSSENGATAATRTRAQVTPFKRVRDDGGAAAMELDPAFDSAAGEAAGSAAGVAPSQDGAQGLEAAQHGELGRAAAVDTEQWHEQQAAGGAEQQPQPQVAMEEEQPPPPQQQADLEAQAAAEAAAAAQAAAEAEAAAAAQQAAVLAGNMPFGQFAGRPLTHVPVSYVSWMCQQEGIFVNPPVGEALRQRMLELNLIQPAPPGAAAPVTGRAYLSQFQPVWRVAPATPEDQQAAQAAVMAFGMHAGLRVRHIPANYIRWMCDVAPGFWNLDQPYKRTLLRQLEVLGRVEWTAGGEVVLAAGELAALQAANVGQLWQDMDDEDWDNNHMGLVVGGAGGPLQLADEDGVNDEGDGEEGDGDEEEEM